MPSAFLVSPASPSPSFTPSGFLMRFAMTFHLGGPDIKALLFLELGEQVTLPLGWMCPEGDSQSAILLNLPSPRTPAH